jgi:predicted glycoside hydrolase/deacetylase ChbG (UPF0249 family)
VAEIAGEIATTAGSTGPTATAPAQRRIWLCADDYGISPAVSAAIRDLVARGRLNATSVMVAAPSFDRTQAQSLAMLNAGAMRVAIGLHVTLTAPFHPLSNDFTPHDGGAFPSLGHLMARAFLRRLDRKALDAEVAAQLAAFARAFGRPPDFVDGHQHVHLLPQVRDAVLAGVTAVAPSAWLRQCGLAVSPLRRLSDRKALLLHALSRTFRRRAARLGLRTNPAFAGTYDFAGSTPFAERFPQFLQALPDGGVVMCHPGTVDDELARLDPLTTLREQEYAYLASGDFARLLDAQGASLA